MKILLENWREYLKEYEERKFSEYGDTFLKYIPKINPFINNGELHYEMHIGVDPDYQGQGVAAKIIMDFVEESSHPLFFAKGRITNPNLTKVLQGLESDPRVEKVEYGWLIR